MTDNPVAPGSPNTLATSPEIVRIVFTYDDGPFYPGLTRQVLDTVKSPSVREKYGEVKLAFFVQTHVDQHIRTPEGLALLREAHEAGHLIGIHNGGLPDDEVSGHHWHPAQAKKPPPAPTAEDPTIYANALHADLGRAMAKLVEVLPGYTPEFVRATEGRTSSMNDPHSNTNQVYGWVGLKQILWNVDSRDSWGLTDYSFAKAKGYLDQETRTALSKGRSADPTPFKEIEGPPLPKARSRTTFYPRGPGNELVVLFHDHNVHSVGNVEAYMDTVAAAVTGWKDEAGNQSKTPRFVTSTDEIRQMFIAREEWDRYDHPWHNMSESETNP